jgi:hypothetical protein
MNGTVGAIFICPEAGKPMERVPEVRAITGVGLEGDRYSIGEGSWNRDRVGHRQVTLINGIFFEGSGFSFEESRRNIVTFGIELMKLIGKEFQIGTARFRGVKYCDPCERPSNLSANKGVFREAFFDRGGLVAEVIEDGVIQDNNLIIPLFD